MDQKTGIENTLHRFILILMCVIVCTHGHTQEEWFTSYTQSPAVFGDEYLSVYSGCEDDSGYLWFATNRGLIRYDGYESFIFTSLPGDSSSLGTPNLIEIENLNDSLLAIGTSIGTIELFNKRTFKTRRVSVYDKGDIYIGPIHPIRGLEVDPSGIVWATGQFGLHRIDPVTEEVIRFQPFPTDQKIPGWTKDSNLTWDVEYNFKNPSELIVSGQFGLFRFDTDQLKFTFSDATIPAVNCIMQDTARNTLFLSSWTNGFMRYDQASSTPTQLYVPLENTGTTNSIIVSDQFAMLYRYNEGFGLLDMQNLSVSFSKDTAQNPWLEQEFVKLADDGFIDRNHQLWIFANYNYWKFQLPNTNTQSVPVLAATRISNTDGSQAISFSQNSYSLPMGQTSAAITVCAINPPAPELVTYAFSLDNKLWTDIGSSREVLLTNLSHGAHTLFIRATDSASFGSVEAQVIQLQVEVPFWNRTIFKLLGILALIGILLLLFYQYNSTLRARSALKENERAMAELELKALRSQMNPHFMFNSLNSIKNYILQAEPRIAAEYLSNFSHLIRLILQNSGAKLISLKDEMETLMLYIDLEKLRFDDEFEFNCIIDEKINLQSVMIPPMIMQPYIENAIWHGLMHKDGIGQLTIELKLEGDKVQCVVEDNGVGRAAAARLKDKSIRKYRSMGMGITKDRIDIINRMDAFGITTHIEDLIDSDGKAAGTRVSVVIPANIEESIS